MRLDPNQVLQQIANLKLVFPDIWDEEEGDERLLTDCLEAETNLTEYLRVVVDRIHDAAAMAGGIATRIITLEERQARYERKQKAYRDLAFKIMEAAELRKLELPEATLSIRNGQQHVVITDEAAIPANFIKTNPTPDKAKIKDCLKAGQDIPGTVLSNSAPSLSIRTK